VERLIYGFHRDEENDWVAEISCGHDQHMRHRPPFQLREWTTDAAGRDSHVETPIGCSLCDRTEMPLGLRRLWSTPEWDENSVPLGLLCSHTVDPRTWGQIVVRDGQLRFMASTKPTIDVVLGVKDVQAIPPDVEHEMHPLGPVHFSVQFLGIDREVGDVAEATLEDGRNSIGDVRSEGGNPVCWAHLICPECGIHFEDCDHG
jgi:tellurite methyltransferase